MRRSLTADLALGVRVALVGGLVLGLRESLAALQQNVFAFASDYLWLYALTPILLWGILATLIVLPAAIVFHVFGKADALGLYGAVLGAAGAASVAIPWASDVEARLRQVDAESVIATGVLIVIALVAVVAAAFLGGAAAAWYQSRTRQPLRYLSIICAAVYLASAVPLVDFVCAERRLHASPAAVELASIDGERPNVLLISIDTLRADVLGSYGHAGGLSPNLDRLARDGIRFSQAFASSPWTLPSMASLFTGLDARRHGAGRVTRTRDPLGKSPLPADLWTLTRSFQEHGYQTAAIVTNPYLALRYGFGGHFDHFENLSILAEGFVAVRETTLMRLAAWLLPAWMPGDRSRFVTAGAVDWLRHRDPGRPFFLWVHYIDPHAPYSPGIDVSINSFRGDSLLGGTGGGDFTVTTPDIARLRSGEIRPDAAQKRRVRQLYDGEVAEVDAAVGVLLDELDAAGLTAPTLVVAISDHGEEFWEHGGVEHGRTVYDEVVRIPLLMRFPGRLPVDQSVSTLVGIVDVAPTILDLLDWDAPAQLDGASAVALWDDDHVASRSVLIENMHFAEERAGLRTPTRKYVRWENGKEEAYDLSRDPGELVDLAGVEETIAPLRAHFGRLAAGDETRDVIPPVEPSHATREALRALGYVE